MIIGDEMWDCGYGLEIKVQSLQWKIPDSLRPMILTILFNYEGIVHHDYVPIGQTIMKEYYIEV